MQRFMPNFNEIDRRILDTPLGNSRGDSAFLRMHISDDMGLSRIWNSFGLRNAYLPPAPNDVNRGGSQQFKDELPTNDETTKTHEELRNALEEQPQPQ